MRLSRNGAAATGFACCSHSSLDQTFVTNANARSLYPPPLPKIVRYIGEANERSFVSKCASYCKCDIGSAGGTRTRVAKMGLMVTTWAKSKNQRVHVSRGTILPMGLAKYPLRVPTGGLARVNPFDLLPDEMLVGCNLHLPLGEGSAGSAGSGGTQQQAELLVTRPKLDKITIPSFPSLGAELVRGIQASGNSAIVATRDDDLYDLDLDGSLILSFNGTSVPNGNWALEYYNSQVWASHSSGVSNPGKKINLGGVISDWANSPPPGNVLCIWKARMLIGGITITPERLYFSDIGNPESPAAQYGTNWVDLQGGRGTISQIASLGETAIVFKDEGVWVIYDSNTFENRVLSETLGIPSEANNAGVLSAVAVHEGRVYFIDNESRLLYSTDGVEIEQVTPQFGAFPPNFYQVYVDEENGRLYILSGVSSNEGVYYEIALGKKGSRGYPPVFKHTARVSTPVQAWSGFMVQKRLPNFWHSLVIAEISAIGVIDLNVPGQWSESSAVDNGVAASTFFIAGPIGIQERENIERIRRLNVIYRGEPTIHCHSLNTGYFDTLTNENLDVNDLSGFSGALTDPNDASVEVWGQGKTRPETRGRYHYWAFSRQSGTKPIALAAAEIVYRGGKES